MPFSMIETALGGAFVLIWLFIGWMMLGDRLSKVRKETPAGPFGPHSGPSRPKYTTRGRRRIAVDQHGG